MAKPDADVVDDPKDVDRIRDVVETANAEDETKPKPDNTDEDADDSEDDDAAKDGGDGGNPDEHEEDDESDEGEEEEKPKPKSDDAKSTDFKYSQFADEDPNKHIINLEQAYSKSSAEGVRLHNELKEVERRVQTIVSAASADPELAEKLNKLVNGEGVTPGDKKPGTNILEDPFVGHLRKEFRDKSVEEVKAILESNPEIASDPELGPRVKYWMDKFAAAHQEETGKLMSGGDAMRAAMKYLGIDEKSASQQNASKLKGLAAPTRPTGSRKAAKTTTSSKPVSDAAYQLGAAMGVSREKVEKYAIK